MFSWLLIATCTLSFRHILTTISFLKHQKSSFFHHVALLITISFQMILSESILLFILSLATTVAPPFSRMTHPVPQLHMTLVSSTPKSSTATPD